MYRPRRPGAIARMAAGSALSFLFACSGNSAAPSTTTTASTTTTEAPTTTVGPQIGGDAGLAFASPLDGYSVEQAPAGTNDDLLTTIERIPGAGTVIGSVDVRLITATADSSTALVVVVSLRAAAASQAPDFANAEAASLARGNPLDVSTVGGLPATYIEGSDPLGGTGKLRAVLVQKGADVALVLAVQADRAALERLAAALVPHLG
jgi:hypothetical protein